MENLTPPVLESVRDLRWRISSGQPMSEALRAHLEHTRTDFAQSLREWWALSNQGRKPTAEKERFRTHYQRAAIQLIERGCRGEPTLEHLAALEDEIELAATNELELFLAGLPFKVLLPLLFFQFPAYLVLLLGPVLRELTRQMGG